MTDAPTPAPARTPGLLRAAVVLAWLEAAALAAYAVSIGISAAQTGSTVASAPFEVAVFLAMAAGIALCGWALGRRRRAARTPFGVIQLFGVVTGWTLTQGDGDLTHRLGYAVLAVSVVGIALVLSPALGEALDS